ncbi:hypothetical protein H2200_011449 [Cladophialophora chaetospira]|uniref:Uncharacterized protein n=1 Tax=Cladophialophora chaetospira TaxID=386627 RepID=A0AA38WZB8_9EURO|nr:hypothetical protein H2200_011449 [Cladophialophora chaetospira]
MDQPQNFPAIGGPNLPPDQIALFYRSFEDAILLAKHTAMFWPCDAATDERFLRYFRADQADLVKCMFRTIANIPLDLDFNDFEAVLRFIGQGSVYSPKFNKLSIYFLGNHPGLSLPQGPGVSEPNCYVDDTGAGKAQGHAVPLYGGKSCLVSICRHTYQYSPMLADIIKPPAWAKDPNKDQSQGPKFYDGFGCENLGSTDSYWFDSPAAVILHELFHFPGLFEDIPEYNTLILSTRDVDGTGPGSGLVPHFVDDFGGTDGEEPKNGYGPYNARQLNLLLPADDDGVRWQPIDNADNYAFYALSSYFSEDLRNKFWRSSN